MNPRTPFFTNCSPTHWSTGSYDLAIFALGFESRATSLLPIVRTTAKALVALGFSYGHEQAYRRNHQVFSEAGVQVVDNLPDVEFENEIKERLARLRENEKPCIFVDISCFSRFRLAVLVHELFGLAHTRNSELIVDFGYSLAQFEKPSIHREPNTVVGPAHPSFAGWSQGGYSSTATVLGLGYEQDQALGVVEYLQAGEVWAFTPSSPVEEYKPEVRKANELLLSEMPRSHVLEYDVCSPASIVATLESVVRGLGDEHSVVLVPFGPKVFVLCSLLVAAMRRDIAVWRVSQGSSIKAHDRRPSHVRVGLRVRFPEGGRTVQHGEHSDTCT